MKQNNKSVLKSLLFTSTF